MLAISIGSDDLCLHKKSKENINGGAIFVMVVVERWAAFLTGKMYWLQRSLKIGRFGPGFQ